MSADNKSDYENFSSYAIVECSIPQSQLELLRKMGLWCSPPMPCFGGGIYIYKPVSAGGNSIPGYEPPGLILFDYPKNCLDDQPLSDAAKVALFKDTQEDKWLVYGVDCAGGMGPADFVTEWVTLDEAIEDIKNFYFGDATRMNAKAADHKIRMARLSAF